MFPRSIQAPRAQEPPQSMRAMDEVVSASFNRRSEDVRVLTVIVAELELSNIERHVLAADLVKRAEHAALEDRPEALNRIRVNRADNIFVRGVIDDFMLREDFVEVFVTDPMIGHEQTDLVRDGLANEFG